jgi:hypothetical protein
MSQIFHEMKTIKDKVELLLIEFPHLRSSDKKLIATFYKYQIKELKRSGEIIETISELSAMDILKMIAEGDLANAVSIVRDRRKIQKENPALRPPVEVEEARNYSDEHIRTHIHDL